MGNVLERPHVFPFGQLRDELRVVLAVGQQVAGEIAADEPGRGAHRLVSEECRQPRELIADRALRKAKPREVIHAEEFGLVQEAWIERESVLDPRHHRRLWRQVLAVTMQRPCRDQGGTAEGRCAVIHHHDAFRFQAPVQQAVEVLRGISDDQARYRRRLAKQGPKGRLLILQRVEREQRDLGETIVMGEQPGHHGFVSRRDMAGEEDGATRPPVQRLVRLDAVEELERAAADEKLDFCSVHACVHLSLRSWGGACPCRGRHACCCRPIRAAVDMRHRAG